MILSDPTYMIEECGCQDFTGKIFCRLVVNWKRSVKENISETVTLFKLQQNQFPEEKKNSVQADTTKSQLADKRWAIDWDCLE